MEYVLIVIFLLVLLPIWFLWKNNAKAINLQNTFDDVKLDTPVTSNASFIMVKEYCINNNLKYENIRETLIITYDEKIITVKEYGKGTIFFVQG